MNARRLATSGRFAASVGAVLALALALQLAPELHSGPLHPSKEAGAQVRVDGGCQRSHPPGFEARRGERLQSCPGCLVQLQSRTAPGVAPAPFAPHLAVERLAPLAGLAPPSATLALAYPRGPPPL